MRKHALVPIFVLAAVLAAGQGCGRTSNEEVKVGGIDLTEMLQGLLDRTSRALGGVQGIDSAKAAVPELRLINEDYDDMLYHVDKLSPKGREELAKKARLALPGLQDVAWRINDNPSLSEVLGGEMNAMLEKLTQLAAAPEQEGSR